MNGPTASSTEVSTCGRFRREISVDFETGGTLLSEIYIQPPEACRSHGSEPIPACP